MLFPYLISYKFYHLWFNVFESLINFWVIANSFNILILPTVIGKARASSIPDKVQTRWFSNENIPGPEKSPIFQITEIKWHAGLRSRLNMQALPIPGNDSKNAVA